MHGGLKEEKEPAEQRGGEGEEQVQRPWGRTGLESENIIKEPVWLEEREPGTEW